MGEKQRLDKALVLRALAKSRGRAKELIKKGVVSIGGIVITDSALEIGAEDEISLSQPDITWVSRSALKLEHALTHYAVDVKGLVALDIGASTGGFTEVLLSRGVTHVYALDVGHGQLAEKLQHDARVTNMERTHINEMQLKDFPLGVDVVTIDVSFISITKILETVYKLLPIKGKVIALVKPQFEVGRELINKGIVKDEKLRLRVLAEVALFARSIGFTVSESEPSPIVGTDGNQEFLLELTK